MSPKRDGLTANGTVGQLARLAKNESVAELLEIVDKIIKKIFRASLRMELSP